MKREMRILMVCNLFFQRPGGRSGPLLYQIHFLEKIKSGVCLFILRFLMLQVKLHTLSSAPELQQITQEESIGLLVACCVFREHLSQEAIGGRRVVACSQLQH